MPQRAAATAPTPARKRAPRVEGQRTTLRVPTRLVVAADRLAAELGITRNDALIRLATQGAEIQERRRLIAERREARRAAIFGTAAAGAASEIDPADFPTHEEVWQAIRGDDDAAEDGGGHDAA